MVANGQIGIGWDLAGVIDAVGPAVDRYEIGDPVVGMRHLLSASIGAQAEWLVVVEVIDGLRYRVRDPDDTTCVHREQRRRDDGQRSPPQHQSPLTAMTACELHIRRRARAGSRWAPGPDLTGWAAGQAPGRAR